MIERIVGMPPGTIGLRAAGKLSKDDYVEVLEPALREGIESGELRLLFVLSDFDGLELGAWPEDLKTGLRSWVRDHSAWKRFALVTDTEWVAKAMHMLTWLTPGEVMVCGLAEEDEARAWVAA
ncbi:MAG: STAS/SEC14 domain-containing protein [Solirubrobacterales bacterium]